MADEAPSSPVNPAAAPSYSLVGQYIRDLSFENPGAPGSIINTTQPTFQVAIDTNVKKQADDVYAVELSLKARAERDNAVLFNVELVYGGVYRIKNIPEAQLAPLLMVDCPMMIFPFARQVLANTVQSGGFPPIMLEPYDFRGRYLQTLRTLQAQQQAAQNGGTTPPAAPAAN